MTERKPTFDRWARRAIFERNVLLRAVERRKDKESAHSGPLALIFEDED
jgi:hypothetical protein